MYETSHSLVSLVVSQLLEWFLDLYSSKQKTTSSFCLPVVTHIDYYVSVTDMQNSQMLLKLKFNMAIKNYS